MNTSPYHMPVRRSPLRLEPLEPRELNAVNALSTAGLTGDPVEVREWRLRQEASDVDVVRGQLGTATATLASLRQEVLDAEAALAALGPVQVPTLQADGANRRVNEHTTLTMGGQTAEAWTGWERHGVVVRDGSLIAVGSSSGSMTTVEQPQGTDNIALRFTTPQTDLRAVRLRPLVSGQNMTGEAWVITGTGTVIKSNFSSINGGSVPLPVHNSVSYVVVVWRSGGGYSLDAIERAAPADPVRQAAESRVTAARANEQAGLAALQPDALRVRLREELSDVVFGAARFGVGVPTSVSSGQELISVTPTAQAWAPNSVELAFRFAELAGSYDLLQNGSVKVRFNPGTSTLTIPYDGSASLGNWSLRNVATGATTSLDLLVTRNVQSGVFSFLKPSNSQAYGTQSLTPLTGLVARPVLTAERFNMGGVSPTTQSAVNALLGGDLSWLQNVPLTANELSAGRDRLSAGTANDEATLRTALLARPGVEAVQTPSLTFQTGWNMTGQHTLTVNGSDLPDGSRLVLASDAGLTQVLDERSLLAGSDGVTMPRGSATFVGLVDASGQVLGQPFTLADESGWLMVRQGGALVGQPNTTLPAIALAGVLTPVTKDSLQSVTPSVRFVTSGSSVDLRYEWLPVGAVVTLSNPVDGTVSPPVTVTSRTGNLPLYLPANQGRILTINAADGRPLFRPMGVARRADTGQMSFYEVEPPWNRWVPVLELASERTLATREEARGVEAGRSTLLPRLNAVSISADTASRRNWGAALGELAGISLSLSEREIARRHLPNLIGANVTEDCTLVLAEIDRLTALPGSNSRGWNERFVLSMVSDAYARAREDIRTAWPIFCEMIVAGFQVVQSTRTDAANVTPVSAVEQTRNFYAQSAQLLHLLPSSQTILSCLTQHFDRCHAFLSASAATWQQEVNAASAAGSITKDPNPGLRGTESPQQRAYDAALSAFGDAERLHRQAVGTGVARYISAAVVTLDRARVTLQQAEAALKGTNTATTPAQLSKLTLENGDVITVLNKTSLQYILTGLPTKIASATARLQGLTSATARLQIQQELTHWQMLTVATEGLLSLIPAGQTLPTLSTPVARGWTRYIERTTTDPVPGGLVPGDTHTSAYDLSLSFGVGEADSNPNRWVFSKTLPTQEVAGTVTLAAEGRLGSRSEIAFVPLDVSTAAAQVLRISTPTAASGLRVVVRNGAGQAVASFQSVNGQGTAKVSLAPGHYVATVSYEPEGLTSNGLLDAAATAATGGAASQNAIPFKFETLPEVVNNGSRKKVEGYVSLDGRGEAHRVSLSVAEFFNDGSRKADDTSTPDSGGVQNLDASRPVWVVIHGMVSSEKKAEINALARELYLSGQQVVTLDWTTAAIWKNVPTDDAVWTPAVGTWAANQLLALGFAPHQINQAGHSHGTYVGYHLAKRVMDVSGGAQVNAFVALDPAGNSSSASGYDDSQINFAAVSRNSLALEGSYGAGNNALAATADVTFRIDSASTWNVAISAEHNLPVTAFAQLLKAHRTDASLLPRQLSLAGIMTSADTPFADSITRDTVDTYEGVLSIDFYMRQEPDPDHPGGTREVRYAAPLGLEYYRDDRTTKQVTPLGFSYLD